MTLSFFIEGWSVPLRAGKFAVIRLNQLARLVQCPDGIIDFWTNPAIAGRPKQIQIEPAAIFLTA